MKTLKIFFLAVLLASVGVVLFLATPVLILFGSLIGIIVFAWFLAALAFADD